MNTLLDLKECLICKAEINTSITKVIFSCINYCTIIYPSAIWIRTKNYKIKINKIEEKSSIFVKKDDNTHYVEPKLILDYWFNKDWLSDPNLDQKIESLLFFR